MRPDNVSKSRKGVDDRSFWGVGLVRFEASWTVQTHRGVGLVRC